MLRKLVKEGRKLQGLEKWVHLKYNLCTILSGCSSKAVFKEFLISFKHRGKDGNEERMPKGQVEKIQIGRIGKED